MEWPLVYVLIVTYNRPEEVRRTITGLRTHLRYPGPIRWHLADDGSPAGYLEGLLADFSDLSIGYSVTDRRGWGVNVNRALEVLRDDYIFKCEDDYVAKRDLDLAKGILLLEHAPTIGLVRFDGVSGHPLTLSLCETETPLGRLDYLRVLPESPFLNVYSNRPHLVNPGFHQHYGLYPEGRKLGETEECFAHTVKDKLTDGPGIAVLPEGIPNAFDHIGHSWQGTCYDTA